MERAYESAARTQETLGSHKSDAAGSLWSFHWKWRNKRRRACVNYPLCQGSTPVNGGRVQDGARSVEPNLEGMPQEQDSSSKLNLKRELNALRLEQGESLTKFVARARSLKDAMAAAGYKVEDDEIVLSVLSGLPAEYDMAVTAITAMGDELRLEDVLSKLLQAEQRLRGKPSEPSAEEKAYVVKAKPRRFGDRNGARPKVQCFYCGKPGHIQAECRKKKADMQNGSFRAGTAGPGPTALMAIPASDRNNQFPWVLDSGATRHLACDSRLLHDLRDAGDVTVTYGNGEQARATAVGTARFTTPESPQGLELETCCIFLERNTTSYLFHARIEMEHQSPSAKVVAS